MMVGHKVTLNIDTPGAGESEAASEGRGTDGTKTRTVFTS